MEENKNETLAKTTGMAFGASERAEVERLAALGFQAEDIAAALELVPEVARQFVELAKIPGSPVARLIDTGRALGMAKPQTDLQKAASAGNIEAIRELQKVQARAKFVDLLSKMDDDEISV